MVTSEGRYARWRTTGVVVWSVIGILILLGGVLWLLGMIASALVPFVIAFVIVFLLNAPVRALARRGLSRGLAVLACFVVAGVVIGVLMTFIAPVVARQIVAFANALPDYLMQLDTLAKSLGTKLGAIAIPDFVMTSVRSVSAQLSQLAVKLGNSLAKFVVSAGTGVFTGAFDIVIALVIAFWALRDLPKMREELIAIAGPTYEEDAEHLIRTVTRVVGGYLRGQTIASLVTGTLATIGLSIVGVKYALVLGIITFVFNYLPYVGPFLAALIAALVGLFTSPLAAVLAIVVIILAQNLTDNLVTPRVMSEQVDLHPTLVIFSLLVGGSLFGIPGMLFAIPVAATVKGLFLYYFERQTQRPLATEDGALFRGTQSCEGEDGDTASECDDDDDDEADDRPKRSDT